MNPLILSTFDMSGGAARAAFRLHNGLKDININSQMLVQYKTSDDRSVIGPKNKLEKWLNQMRPTLDNLPLRLYPKHDYGTFSSQWFPDFIDYKVKHLSTDIINIHWTCGYLQIESIAKLRKPLVWTLHDMWAFTGGCHYSLECDRYISSCGACTQLHSADERDLSRWVWKRKQKVFEQLDLTIVTPSHWLAQVAASSPLLKKYPIKVIPNGIDLQKYKPIDKNTARKWLNLPLDKQLILSGAAVNSYRKGMHLFEGALENLSSYKDRVELVFFGSLQPDGYSRVNLKCHYMGNLHDDISLALVYAAADVFVAASIQDNLPNTVMEALACGTPCVTFNIGGMPDMVEHQANGYLAQSKDTKSLAQGISWILSNSSQKIRDRARQKVEQEFNLELQARRYSQLFAEVINQNISAI
ncbi:MAG: glycosyltransferase family 4 protein [Cyanobacteria bacterium P01_D01_bin.50]